MASLADRVYAASPVWLQNIGVSAFGAVWKRRRYGGRFRALVQEFGERERFGPAEWQAYQDERLAALLAHAVATVPHYRRVAERGATLRHFPVLSKESLREAPTAFLSESPSARTLHSYSTSGTTGTPLAVRMSSDMHRRLSAAYEARCRRWAGVNYTMSRAMIGGRLVVPSAVARPPYWRYNMSERQLYLSAFHISPDTAADYAGALEHYRPDYLVGYASAHFFLARFIEERGVQLRHRPRAVLTSSEKLTDEMRATLERVYGCAVFDGYSGVEACCLASECEHHRLHLSPDVGVTELLDDDGAPVAPGEVGELVATGLLNFDQPLIRYRTGDYARLSAAACPCGRAMPVLEELVGRLEDTVVGPDGRETVRFHGLFVGLDGVREGQLVQETLTDFRVRLVTGPGFGARDRAAIADRLAQRLGAVHLEIELVDAIERTHRGKFQAVVSKVRRATAASR